MSLTKYTLGDIALSFSYGSMPKEDDLCEEGYPVFSGYRTVGYSKIYNINKRSLVVVARGVGGTGNVEIAEEKTFLTNLSIAIRINEELADIDYLKYYLNAQGLRYLDTGAAQSQITINNLRHHKVFIPSIDEQKKIAAIITTYDKLVKTNNKRIKVLEKMAENLYKEWFVRFRFPGHKAVAIENGIPVGWKVCRFSQIANILSGGTPNTENDEYYGGTIPFYTPKDSSDNYYVFETVTNITEDGLNHCNSQLYPKDTIMITARGTVGNLNLLAVPMAMNQSCYAINSDVIKSQLFLYFLIKREVTKLKKVASGGVFDTIIINTFDHIKVTVPTDDIIDRFDRTVTPIINESYALQKQNMNLKKQRDLLLLRLMSGKLEV